MGWKDTGTITVTANDKVRIERTPGGPYTTIDVEIILRWFDAVVKAEQAAKEPYEYEDERYCDRCKDYTQQLCIDSDHERDSSGDYQKCLTCKWEYSGYDRTWRPPGRF